MLAKDPALADVVRQEQDLVKQVNAQLGTLNNVLSLASHERDEKGVQALRASINTLRADRDRLRTDIAKRFPAYADLIDPKPPSVEQIKATLKSGEALLSFYFGREASFVWAVPKDGAMAFAAIPATAGDLESKIRKLREALEPQAQSISDIPAFDLKLAHELYTLLLKPVEAGWKQSKQLIVVTNGALGLLPLTLLPTAAAEIKDTETTFAAYRGVPWLARTHAVTMVPSAAALRTLRQIPAGAAGRERMIGFGDPFFSKEQMEAAADEKAIDTGIQLAMADMRGVPLKRRASPQLDGVDSAELGLLPRLPDTAEELRSIALALEADPSKVVQLGVKANERAVKETDLSRYKVIVFATHGLVPGELNGLTQPALALSAPDVSGSGGDGLAHDGGNPGVAARRGLGGAVGLQHRFRRGCRRRGRVRARAGVLLCWDTRAPGHQLVGAFAIGAGSDDRSVPPPERGPEAVARRGAPAGDDGADGRAGLHRPRRQDRVRLRASLVLGAVQHHRRWRQLRQARLRTPRCSSRLGFAPGRNVAMG